MAADMRRKCMTLSQCSDLDIGACALISLNERAQQAFDLLDSARFLLDLVRLVVTSALCLKVTHGGLDLQLSGLELVVQLHQLLDCALLAAGDGALGEGQGVCNHNLPSSPVSHV